MDLPNLSTFAEKMKTRPSEIDVLLCEPLLAEDYKDMILKPFGKLLVRRAVSYFGEVYFFCKCECGGLGMFSERDLKNKRVSNCGCVVHDGIIEWEGMQHFVKKEGDMLKRRRKANKKDRLEAIRRKHVGKKFNMLEIVAISSENVLGKGLRVKCLCDCGKQKDLLYSNVSSGTTKSCGCLRESREGAPGAIERWKQYGCMIATELLSRSSSNRSHRWRCECTICGRTRVFTSTDLRKLKISTTCSCEFTEKMRKTKKRNATQRLDRIMLDKAERKERLEDHRRDKYFAKNELAEKEGLLESSLQGKNSKNFISETSKNEAVDPEEWFDGI